MSQARGFRCASLSDADDNWRYVPKEIVVIILRDSLIAIVADDALSQASALTEPGRTARI